MSVWFLSTYLKYYGILGGLFDLKNHLTKLLFQKQWLCNLKSRSNNKASWDEITDLLVFFSGIDAILAMSIWQIAKKEN